MIYLVSRNKSLFSSTKYSEISFNEAMEILSPLKVVQLDTETQGLECHSKPLLTIQLGCRENQIVFDWTTLTIEEKLSLKQYLESERVFIGHNLQFDLTFLYKQNIWVKHIYDTMIAEQLIYLGYPKVLTQELYNELGIEFPMYEWVDAKNPKDPPHLELSYSLKATAKRRCNIDIDKTVRGKIINEGLTEAVIEYAGGDVMWLEDIKDAQLEELKKQDLVKACEFECEVVKGAAYIKYCGVYLDRNKWESKMKSDQSRLDSAKSSLDKWTINWDKNRVKEGDWDIRYPEMEDSKNYKELVQELIKNKYTRYPQEDLEVPYQDTKIEAYRKKVTSLFTKVDLQGDLFSGFNSDPQCTVNWNSDKQVVKLFELLGIQVKTFDKETKKEKKSVSEPVLKPQKDKFPIIPIYLDYQGASKLVSTYGQNWLNAINKDSGRIHVEIHSIGTDTSRFSSGGGPYKLNQQNLPKDSITRGCFTAEPGNVWISIDYSG